MGRSRQSANGLKTSRAIGPGFQIAFREISAVLVLFPALLGLSLPFQCMGAEWDRGEADRIKANISRVDSDFIEANTKRSRDWPTVGLDYAETRFSKLDQINADNVKDLGLAWTYDLDSMRGVEATPLVVDGIMYVTASWSVVHALDAAPASGSGLRSQGRPRELSARRPAATWSTAASRSTRARSSSARCDGRLIALDAKTGRRSGRRTRSSTTSQPYTITGAPRMVNGKVIIGNGGAEYGVRGYVTAYDAKTGKQLWRFFTVPGDPTKPFENEAMEKPPRRPGPAASTGRAAAAARRGTRWPTTPSST